MRTTLDRLVDRKRRVDFATYERRGTLVIDVTDVANSRDIYFGNVLIDNCIYGDLRSRESSEFRIEPGKHEVKVRTRGQKPRTKVVEVEAGQTVRLPLVAKSGWKMPIVATGPYKSALLFTFALTLLVTAVVTQLIVCLGWSRLAPEPLSVIVFTLVGYTGAGILFVVDYRRTKWLRARFAKLVDTDLDF